MNSRPSTCLLHLVFSHIATRVRLARSLLFFEGEGVSTIGVCVGVWCVVCGVWCVACGVWRVACGVWCVVCVVWTRTFRRMCLATDSGHAAVFCTLI